MYTFCLKIKYDNILIFYGISFLEGKNPDTRRKSKSHGFHQDISILSVGGMFCSDTKYETEDLANDMQGYLTVICIFHDLAHD